MGKTTVGIIGGGNMGAAILAGIRKDYAVSVCEQDSVRRQFLKRAFAVTAKDLKSVVAQSDVVILAVKPQQFEEVLGEVSAHLTKDKLVLSIAAGITCRYIEQKLGGGARVIRTMPNLPAQISEGMTAICKGKRATEQDLRLACRVFDCIGRTVVVQERWMNVVTAVSGSGPAYLFLVVEALQKAAVSLGLNKELSEQLIVQTLKGSLALLEKSDGDAGALRARVTSKGGTTQAAMDVFGKNKFEAIFERALQAAAKRAGELSR